MDKLLPDHTTAFSIISSPTLALRTCPSSNNSTHFPGQPPEGTESPICSNCGTGARIYLELSTAQSLSAPDPATTAWTAVAQDPFPSLPKPLQAIQALWDSSGQLPGIDGVY